MLISTVCRRFEYNAQRLFPRHLKLWKDIPHNFKTSQFLLSKIGFSLREVEIDNDSNSGISIEQTMDLIEKNCTNLEKITLHHSIPSNLLTLPSNIKDITIKFPENWVLSIGFLHELKRFSQLESLSLKFYHFTELDSNFLTELSPLKQLRLNNCSVEPINLQKCLQNSKYKLETLALGNCFPQFPNILIESIDQLVKMNKLEFKLNCGSLDIGPSNIFNRLTSLKLCNTTSSIDLDKLFNCLIQYNKIHTLSFNSCDDTKSLKKTTIHQLHRLTNLRRLFIFESDFVTDEFLTEISKSQNLTHFTYKQTYQPKLSFDAILMLAAVNGPQLEKCSYIAYHDISHMDQKYEQKRELMNVFRKTTAFQRILHCKEDISHKLTSVEFLFKRIATLY